MIEDGNKCEQFPPEYKSHCTSEKGKYFNVSLWKLNDTENILTAILGFKCTSWA